MTRCFLVHTEDMAKRLKALVTPTGGVAASIMQAESMLYVTAFVGFVPVSYHPIYPYR